MFVPMERKAEVSGYRVWAQRDSGHEWAKPGQASPVRYLPGMAHGFVDVTSSPMPTIATRPITVLLQPASPPPVGSMPSASKPPYRVPSMDEIRALPWNGFTAASTFSGCGGSSLGYRMAGFRVAWASEFIPAAAETYRANAGPSTILDMRDIREVTASDVLSALGMEAGQLDLLDGSPPCASFSTAGKREAGWGKVKAYSDTKQRTDDLFFEYARLLDGIRPRVFVAENVSGLVKGTAKGYFKLVLARLREYGYKVEARVLDASWLGVPQARQRLIFVGVRDDLGVSPVFPKPLPYQYTVRDALPEITGPTMRDPETGADISIERYAIGREWERLRPGGKSDKYLSLIRANPGAPFPTVTTQGQLNAACPVHWAECRKLTLGELRRLGGFPDDFALTGTFVQRWERIGRAVPPVMMATIATVVRDRILAPLRKAADA
jgi:DNA (cytosine-5)-methyltransferase 1